MKFSKQLLLRAVPGWEDKYVDYRALKKIIKTLAQELKALRESSNPNSSDLPSSAESQALATAANDDTASSSSTASILSTKILDVYKADVFVAELRSEAARVNIFYSEQEQAADATLKELSATQWSSEVTKDQKADWMEKMSQLIQNLENLSDYTSTNITGFKKILKKFDKNMEAKVTRELWELIADQKFAKSEMDEVLLQQAKQQWRKRIPQVSLEPENELLVVDNEDAPTVNNLDLDALPGGQVSRLWVALSQDGISTHVRVPVMVAKGVKAGPIVGITAALHGNELNGIPLIHRLLREINCRHLHGTLVAVTCANVPGYLRSQRGYSDGTDLNRVMPGKKNGTAAQVYAYNLMDRIISKLECLLDLHTASKGRINSLYVRADMLNPRTRKMASLQNPQIIVHNTSPDGSLRQAAMERGIAAITVEIGDPSRVQKRFVKNALLGVTNILCHFKMIPHEPDLPEYEPIVCSRSYWVFADKGGLLNVIPEIFTWVRRGEPIAYLYNLFGGLVESYYSPEDGIIIGKSVDPVCESGSRILHLGVVDSQFAAASHDGHL